jgi:hypothetical protein
MRINARSINSAAPQIVANDEEDLARGLIAGYASPEKAQSGKSSAIGRKLTRAV